MVFSYLPSLACFFFFFAKCALKDRIIIWAIKHSSVTVRVLDRRAASVAWESKILPCCHLCYTIMSQITVLSLSIDMSHMQKAFTLTPLSICQLDKVTLKKTPAGFLYLKMVLCTEIACEPLSCIT